MTRAHARLVANGIVAVAGAALVIVTARELARRPAALRAARRTVWRVVPCLLGGQSTTRLLAVAAAALLDASSSAPSPAPARDLPPR